MSSHNIQLGDFLKNENWEYHYALSTDPEQKWIGCFQGVCVETGVEASVRIPSPLVEPEKKNQHFAVITGGIFHSEGQLRAQLETIIRRTNETFTGGKAQK